MEASHEAWVGGVLLGLSHLFVGFLVVVLNVPLLKGQIAMNRWYGIRTAKAFASEENWYTLNRYGARCLIRAGVLLMGVGLASCFVMLDPAGWQFWVVVLAPVIVLVVPLIQIVRFSKRLP